jgi:subtilisin family serine protease
VHRYTENEQPQRVRIAVLDTGIDASHPLIRQALAKCSIVDTQGFPSCRDPLQDLHGHGTHVTSVLLKTSPGAALYIARVTDDEGRLGEDRIGSE